jgi:hypothetical protein
VENSFGLLKDFQKIYGGNQLAYDNCK